MASFRDAPPRVEGLADSGVQSGILLDPGGLPKCLGEPAEFAGLVRHLIENQTMNGAIVRIDGGIRMSIRE